MKLPTHEEIAKNIVDQALDGFLCDGKSIRKWIQIIVSEDAISRQEVLGKIREVCFSKEQGWVDFRSSWGSNGQRDFIINFIESLPPVAPQTKTGQWEWVQYDGNLNIGNWHCPWCRSIIPNMPEELDGTPIYKWCPMCGNSVAIRISRRKENESN